MVEKAKKTYKKLFKFWDNLDKAKRIRMITLLVLLAGIITIFSVILNNKSYTVLYQDLEVSEAGEIYSRLQELQYDCKSDGTTIYIEESQENEARMSLATEGYPESGLNYDLYMNSIDFGTTDQEKKKYMVFQLQDRLQTTINTLDGVESSIVTISVPDTDTFSFNTEEQNVSASVVIKLLRGYELSSTQIRAIEQLVQTSYSGLYKENISIIDSKMNILNSFNRESESGETKLNMENEIKNDLEKKILLLLEPVFGYEQVKVGVNVKLDFDTEQTETVLYTPVVDDEGIITSISNLTEKVGEGTETTSQADTDDSVSTESSSETKEENITYQVNETRKVIEKAQGNITDLSVSVLLNNPDIDETMREEVKNIVAYSAGIDISEVNVSSMEFTGQLQLAEQIEEAMNYDDGKLPFGLTDNLILGITALILSFILAILLLRTFNSARSTQVTASGPKTKIIDSKARKNNDNDKQKEEKDAQEELLEDIKESEEIKQLEVNKDSELYFRQEINKYVDKRADDVAQLLSGWIDEDE